MDDPDVLVIGGGPAGVAAAIEVVASGASVTLCEQRPSLGGAIYRQSVDPSQVVASLPSLSGRWNSLSRRLAASPVTVLLRRTFIGIDGAGFVLIDNRASGCVETMRPRVVVIATGAIERVRPRPGWQLEGVVAAGGLQVMLKEGRVPQGRILLAGSGPLLLALAAQLSAAGNPPAAVVEAGDPLAGWASGVRLLSRPALLADVAHLLKPVGLRRFAWYRNTHLTSVVRSREGLTASLQDKHGCEKRITVDRVALHDGLRSNDFGLPKEAKKHGPIVLKAGDVREVLGAHAAESDGRLRGRQAVALLAGKTLPEEPVALNRERMFQEALGRLFQPRQGSPRLTDYPDQTVICRCENKTLGELKALLDGLDVPSARELRLNGRFGMGACQGRFCAEWAQSVMADLHPQNRLSEPADMGGSRWPLRPVRLSSLAAADHVGSAPTFGSGTGAGSLNSFSKEGEER